MAGEPLRVGLLIRSLTVGGAERQLVSLARGLKREGHEVHVLAFYRSGTALEAELEAEAVPLVDLQKHGRWDVVGFVGRLRGEVRTRRLQVIYSFLPTANVLSALLWGGAGGPAVVWGVRGATAHRASHDWLGVAIATIEQRLVKRASAVITNSRAAAAGSRGRGWPEDRLHLVRNGLDADLFQYKPAARDLIRSSWGLAPTDRAIGFAGRLDAVKGFEVLLVAAADICKSMPSVRLAVAGGGSVPYVASLRKMAQEIGVDGRIIWLGTVDDMAGFYSAVDVLCLPSISEGCSNVIAEALACGAPVVATDVGDNADLISDASFLVQPGDAGELAGVLLRVLTSSTEVGRAILRQAILDKLSESLMVQGTVGVLRGVAATKRLARFP